MKLPDVRDVVDRSDIVEDIAYAAAYAWVMADYNPAEIIDADLERVDPQSVLALGKRWEAFIMELWDELHALAIKRVNEQWSTIERI